jgi:plasmid stabilization system protein ParE
MQVIWTNRAIDEYESVMYYILENWTIKEAQKFAIEIKSVVRNLISNPNMFKASQTHPYMRKAKVTKHNSLIYHVDDEQIIILRVIDNRSEELY